MAAAKGAVARAVAMFLFLLLLLTCGGACGMWEVDWR